MAKKKKSQRKAKTPFFKNVWNVALLGITLILAAVVFFHRGDDDMTAAERVWEVIKRGDAGDAVQQTITQGIQTVTEGCAKPPDAEIEAFYKDSAGTIPVARDFDADSGEICGNGKTWYCTSKPPKKPIPVGWKKPPRPGSDPNYEGPPFDAEFKESPYAMPSSKRVLNRYPIRDSGDDPFKDETNRALKRATGKVGYLGFRDPSDAVGDLKHRMVRLKLERFQDDDDEPVAKELMADGIDFVLVDRTSPRIEAWIEEKMTTIHLRLRDSVSLDWFHPVVLGTGFALYRVAPPFEVPRHIKRRITSRVRAILAGQTVESFPFEPSLSAVGDMEHRVIVSLRWRKERGLKGRKLVKRMAHGDSVLAAIDSAANKIKNDWPSIVEKVTSDPNLLVTYVPKDVTAAIAEMEIEVDIVFDQCALTDRAPGNLLWYLEMGLEGLSLRDGSTFMYLEPSYAIHMETNSEIIFLEKLLQKNRGRLKEFLRPPKQKRNKKRGTVLSESAWTNDEKYRFGRFRTVHWVETPGGEDIVELYRGVPLKTIWDVSYASLVKSLELGALWLINNQSEDGSYAYKYTPINKPGKRWLPGGNIVRHALNPYTLLMVNKIKQDPRYVESAKRGIEFTLKFLRKDGNRCCICHRDPPARYYNAKLNAVAVTILSILKLGDVADISEYEDVLQCMAEEMLYMQDKNGHFWQYDVPPDHPYFGAESTIHAGEFIFVLARLYTHYKDERFKASCDKALDYYMQQWRKLVDERTKEGIYDEEHRVNLIGIVPWLVTAMQDLYKITGDMKYAELGFETQNWIDDEFFWWLHRAQYPDYVGASFKVHRELPAVNSCQYAEGAAAAYDIAKRINRDVEKRRQLVVHSMRYCLQVQFDSYGSTFFLPVPEEAMGGYRYTLGHTRLRNDYNYHAMAALAQAAEYLEPHDYPAERPLYIPPVLDELLGDVEGPAKDVLEIPKPKELEAPEPSAEAAPDKEAAPSKEAAPEENQ